MLIDKYPASIDQSNMFQKILEFPKQLLDGWKIGENDQDISTHTGFKHIVLSGMGGSAIGGDIVRSLLSNELRIPFLINRNYRIPDFCEA